MGKKQKTRNWSNTQGKSPEKGKKMEIIPNIQGSYQTESRKKEKGGKMQSFPEQETGEAARNEAQPKPEYPISQAAAAQSTGLRKEDPHLNSSARATAASGARTGELMIGEVEPAELERIRGRSSSEL